MVLTHSEALRLSSEARDAGDREEARKYSRIARDLQARVTSGETKVSFYDNESGRIRHSEAGSKTYVNYMLGTSERYVPVSEAQVKQLRAARREQLDQPQLRVPSQRVEQDGRVLYRVEPGPEPSTAQLLFPSEIQQWTVTYDVGAGERKQTFETEKAATSFAESLTVRQEEAVTAEREQRFTAIDQVGDWSKNVVARTASVNEQTRDFNDQLQEKVGFDVPPGPGAGPAPGSFGETLQTFVERGLSLAESPFVAATTPVRTRAERLRKEAAEEKAGFKGLSNYLAGVALATGASAFDVATLSVRPGLVVKSAVGVGKLLTSAEERKALGETVAADPFGFTAETLGGAFFGAKLADFGRTAIKQAGPVTRAIKAELAVPKRAPFMDILKRAKFVAERETAAVDFSKLLQDEARFRFPEEVVQAEFLDTFIPERTFTTKEVFTFKPLPTGKFRPSGFKGFGRTGEGLVPMVIPEEFAVPTTIYKFRRTPLTIPSGRPGIPIELPQLGAITRTGVSVTDVLAGASIAATRPRIKKPEAIPQIQSPGTVQQNLQRFKQTQAEVTKNIFAPPSGITALKITQPQLQPQLQPQIQPQMFEQKQTQKQRLGVSQIQIPQIQELVKPLRTPLMMFPPQPPRKPTTSAILDYDPRKKKRKPGRKDGIKKAVEKRIDPLEVINWDPRKKRKKQ